MEDKDKLELNDKVEPKDEVIKEVVLNNDDRLKKIIEDRKSKHTKPKGVSGLEFGTVGHRQKARRNKKGGGMFDR